MPRLPSLPSALAALSTAVWLVLAAAPPGITAARAQASGEATGENAPGAAGEAAQRPAPPGRTGLPLPRFVTLRAAEVNLRTGPGTRYPIDWVYQRRGLPVEIIDEFDTWRRIRDWQGTEGWVHQSMVQGQRGILVTGKRHTLRRRPEPGAPGVALVDAGVIGVLRRCRLDWCEVTVDSFTGWLERHAFYGLYPGEAVE